MMLLSLNTSTPQFGLALLNEDGTILAEYFISKEKGFGSLMPTLDFFISKLNADIHDLKAVVVAIGPGSFTGLRVGISAAKGLCHGLDIPIIGISSLKALASQVLYSDLPITPVLYSRKNELYTARFTKKKDHNLIRNLPDTTVKLDNLASVFDKPSIFIGNDFSNQGLVLKKALGSQVYLSPAHYWHLKASAVGVLGLGRFHNHDFDDPQNIEPLYLRPSDIRPNPFPLTAAVKEAANEEKRNTDR